MWFTGIETKDCNGIRQKGVGRLETGVIDCAKKNLAKGHEDAMVALQYSGNKSVHI